MPFSTHRLDEIVRKKREALETTRKELLIKLHAILSRLHEQRLFENAIVFGSVLKADTFSENSDLDIAFTGLADENFFRCMSIVSSELGRDVDIIQLEQCSFKEKIMREGIEWTKIDL